MSSDIFINIPDSGSPSWKAPVDTAADLPASGNNIGDARVAQDTQTIYVWNGTNWIPVATPGASVALDALIGDVSATGPGVAVATVNFVGGVSAANVALGSNSANAATSSNTPNTIVKRDGSGNFSASVITSNLIGNVTGNVSGSSGSFTGSLSGDVTGTQSSTVVSSVGGKTSAQIAQSVSDTQAATDLNTSSTIVKRDSSGNFSAGNITANLTGNISGTALNVTGIVLPSHGGTGIANNDSATLTRVGNFALTLTLSNTTSLTAPTSGTLATLTGIETFTNKTINAGLNTLLNITNSSIDTNAGIIYSKLNLLNSIVNADINTSASIDYSKLNLALSIVNSDISPSAAIDYSKLNLTASIVNSDISNSAAIAYSKLNLSNSIVNADISTIANIAISKLASGSAFQFIRENNGGSSPIYIDLLGTSNQVIVANNAGNTTLSLPQSIATSSSPTFLNLTLNGNLNATGTISASNFSGSSSGTNTGDVTLGTANGLSLSGQVLSLQLSDSTHTGALSSTDWNTFNNKQSTITIGALDAQTANANGLALVSNVLSTQSADATHPGMVNNTVQTFSGNKTLSGQTSISNTSTTALTINSTSFIFDATNNTLGINNSSPVAASFIDGVNTSNATKRLLLTGYGSASLVGFRTRLARGTIGTPLAVQANDILGFFNSEGYGTSQFPANGTGAMTIYANETFTNTSNATYIGFNTTPTGTTSTSERLRINSTGNVLIGTTTDNGNNKLQVNGSFISGTFALTDAANIATDTSLANTFTVTLAGNRNLSAPTNPTDKQKVTWIFTQDATGGRTLSFDAIFDFGNMPSLILSSAANKIDYMGAIYNTASTKWNVVAYSTGF